MATIEKEAEKKEQNLKKSLDRLMKKAKTNPWILVSIVLAIILIVIVSIQAFPTKGQVSKTVVDALNEMVGGGVELQSVENTGSGIYTVKVIYQGNEIPVQVTRDGKYMIMGTQELNPSAAADNPNTDQPNTDVPKTDKPKVELYVWSYCPYGVSAQGPLADVALLLGNTADFEVIPYYDGHGAFETQQNKIQSCIQKLYLDKYWAYSKSFVEDIYPKCGASREVACDKDESVALMKKLGIDSTKVMSCVDSEGVGLLEDNSARAQANDVSGSPTLIINGVAVNSARTSEAYKTAVCSAYNNAPEECSEVLSGDAATTTGSC